MRKLAAAGLAFAVIAGNIASSGWAQTPEATLPEVTVTAPRSPPRPAPPQTGMLGNLRVDEQRWPVIPCAGARIGAVTSGRCQVGPSVITAAAYMGSSNVPNAYGPCTIAHQLITTDIGRFSVEADVEVFDPYKLTADQYNARCTVWSGYDHLPGDFHDMNQVTRRGIGWRGFEPGNGQSGAQSTIEFSDNGRSCVALERLGPPWHGGFVWVLHATLCQTDPAPPITGFDISATVGAIRISTYDPDGNLRPPPRAPGG